MKLKKIKKHTKKVKLTMKFDSIEAANSMYERIHDILNEELNKVEDTAITVPNNYIRIERWEKKPKIVVTASGREIMDKIF